jgi:hypothetical protein
VEEALGEGQSPRRAVEPIMMINIPKSQDRAMKIENIIYKYKYATIPVLVAHLLTHTAYL